jgi:lipopolysaccharide/colanic/teichoic acid biosynthesis glycosyltransferase
MANYSNLSGSWMSAVSTTLFSQVGTLTADRFVARRERVEHGYGAATARAIEPVTIEPDDLAVEDVAIPQSQVVLDQEIFRSVLKRERRRADRFDEKFALVTVKVSATAAGRVAAALASSIRTTDAVGWLKQGSLLGVILSNVALPTDEAAQKIEARVQTEFARRLDPATVEALHVRWYVHDGPKADGDRGLSESDPLFDDIAAASRERSVVDALKRTLDFCGSLALLLFLAPVLLVVAALVKLTSPGPVLFRQVRVGQLAKPFTMLKFRTMHVNNDSAIHQKFVADFIKSGANEPSEGGEKFFKIKNDPRLTAIGAFLRKTSIDELPQLLNVLLGDMSLVGPRPPLHYELEQYRAWHWRRVLEAKPGVTGLWQVVGRSRTTFDEMVRLDLRYVRTRNLWTDIRILLATPRAVVTGKGAC